MKFKQLEWIERDCLIAYTPASRIGYVSICYEQGLYWAGWDMTLRGVEELDVLKLAAQQFHEQFLMQYVEA